MAKNFMVELTGNTFSIKGELKECGFRWNANKRVWYKVIEDDEERAYSLAEAYTANGVYGEVHLKTDKDERKYFIKESWLFNLESMHDRIWCLIYDMRENKIALPFEVAGKTINNEHDLFSLMDEAEELQFKAHGKVTGKEYARIKEIVSWRVIARYAACMAAGMDEADAGRCFEDM